MIRFDTFIIWFFMPIFVGCAKYQIENNTPIFLDTQRGYGRIYTAEKIAPSECGAPDYQFTYSKKNIPINAYSSAKGFISGTNWVPKSIISNQTEDNYQFDYIVDGVVEWKLLGFIIYAQSKEYSGKAILK